MKTWKYQVALLGGARDPRVRVVRETLLERSRDLGLRKGELVFFRPGGVQQINPSSPVAAMFFGGKTWNREAERAVPVLQALDAFVLPVVPTTKGYGKLVPASLKGINGLATQTEDELRAAALRVVEELGLVRRSRHAFISYCRSDSKRAAEQLYHALDARGWDVFLDTHSVTTGVPFQPVLWDRMNDADLVMLLDTPGCSMSRWVGEELARAANLGLGMLQVVWPDHTRDDETEFADARYLNHSDFRSGPSGYGGRRLKQRAVSALVLQVESIRARALAARRARLVRELCSQARTAGLRPIVHPERFVEIRKMRHAFLFLPTTGQPRSADLHEAVGLQARGEPRLLYDPTGMLDASRNHIGWLNDHLPVKAVATTSLSDWLVSP